MRYQTFGRRTGLRVSEYALGTANFGPSAAGLDGARQIFDAFADAGGTTIDTSDRYQGGQAESLLGDLLTGRRDEFVVITKYTSAPGETRPGMTGNGRRTMVRSLEASLGRLKTDYVDVFMPHFPDQVTPMDEIRAGFDDLIRAGKIRHGALSNFPAWRVAGAVTGHSPVIGIQTEYSLAERSGERELLPMAEAHGLGVLIYSPLAGGLLTGKYRQGETGRLSTRGSTTTAQQDAVLDIVLAIAAEREVGPVQVALAWLRERSNRSATALIPIVGARTPAQLDAYLRALDLDLTPEQYQKLDDVSAVVLGTPHEDVLGAIQHGLDGDRSVFRPPLVPAI
jgi:aryl-alcohol dehydrogenase-like predicted oxidoreductase